MRFDYIFRKPFKLQKAFQNSSGGTAKIKKFNLILFNNENFQFDTVNYLLFWCEHFYIHYLHTLKSFKWFAMKYIGHSF